jgi:hypothetical protein
MEIHEELSLGHHHRKFLGKKIRNIKRRMVETCLKNSLNNGKTKQILQIQPSKPIFTLFECCISFKVKCTCHFIAIDGLDISFVIINE